MARPAKQGMDYFPHDTDAASDEKVESLRILYGNDGYAFYFILLERIYRTADFEIDISDAETRQILARKVEVTPQKFDDMLSTALKRGCFDVHLHEKHGVLTSNGIKKRAESVVLKRQKMADSYQKRVSDAETPPETPQRKEKEKESKADKERSIALFEKFWSDYNKKRAKKKVQAIWSRMTLDQQERAAAAAKPYALSTPDEKYRKDPEGWLNAGRYDDEPPTPTPAVGNGQPKERYHDEPNWKLNPEAQARRDQEAVEKEAQLIEEARTRVAASDAAYALSHPSQN